MSGPIHQPGSQPRPRKRVVAILGACLLVAFLLLGALNAFNLHFLNPGGTAQILVFSGISTLTFVLLLTLLILLLRNILKLYADQRSRALGSRLRTRMVIAAMLVSFAPAVFMLLFSFLLMNRSIDRWFSLPTSQLREEAGSAAMEAAGIASYLSGQQARTLASLPEIATAVTSGDATEAEAALANQRITSGSGFSVLLRKNALLAQHGLPSGAITVLPWLDQEQGPALPANRYPVQNLLQVVRSSRVPVVSINGHAYILSTSFLPEGQVVVGTPLPDSLVATTDRIRRSDQEYWTLYRSRNGVRSTYLLMLLVLTTLVFFTSTWLALFFSKQITRPVEALADAMHEIAAGHYEHRVTLQASQELGDLVAAFNEMASDLEASRSRAESSAAQLSTVNLRLEERHRELETILETIPSAVAILDSRGRIVQSNQTFINLLAPGDTTLIGRVAESLFPAETAEEMKRTLRRSQRMGHARTEVDLRSGSGNMVNLAVSLALLQLDKGRRGLILVLDDTTEQLRMQRQVAWKEVAQRVAHEIKNPLTPILLSAERIERHVDRPTAESAGIIRKCSGVILSSVATLRTLVDQFAALAQFPVAKPKISDANHIIEAALELFQGRMEGVSIRLSLTTGLPSVMADPDALKRALANLIDNAAEAMQGGLYKLLSISSSYLEDNDMVEIVVADTGPGITPEIRERLFLPFASSKQRGTGLGLSIAAKILQEHHGTIRAENNAPTGTRFILQIPIAEAHAHEGQPTLTTTAGGAE